jgi:hypothetical protein
MYSSAIAVFERDAKASLAWASNGNSSLINTPVPIDTWFRGAAPVTAHWVMPKGIFDYQSIVSSK